MTTNNTTRSQRLLRLFALSKKSAKTLRVSTLVTCLLLIGLFIILFYMGPSEDPTRSWIEGFFLATGFFLLPLASRSLTLCAPTLSINPEQFII